MDISVILPTYNNGKYIERAVNSVINQEVEELELIVINDGSTDNSAEILEDLAGKHSCIRVITQENRGVSAARNAGLDAASGEFVAFLDGDDTFRPDAIEEMLFLAGQWEADLVVGEFRRIQSFGESILKNSRLLSQKVIIQRDDVGFINSFSVCNKMFRRSIIEEHRLRFPIIRHAEDGVFLHSFLDVCGKIIGCPRVVYEYHKALPFEAKSALSRLDALMFDDLIVAVEEIQKLVKERRTESMQRTLNARIFRTSIVNEYYRHLWILEKETLSKVMTTAEQYREKLTEEDLAALGPAMTDLESEERLKTKEEILEDPYLSVAVAAGLEEKELSRFLDTLYYQDCPNFEVWLDGCYRQSVPEEYTKKENLYISEQDNCGLRELASQTKGRCLQIIDGSAIYNENTVRLMLRNRQKLDLDFISVLPLGYREGTTERIDRLNSCFTKKGRRNAEKNPKVMARHNEIDCRLFNKLFRRNALMDVLKELDETAGPEQVCGTAFGKLTYRRVANVRIGLQSGYEPKKPKAPAEPEGLKPFGTEEAGEKDRNGLPLGNSYRIARKLRRVQADKTLFLGVVAHEPGGNLRPLADALNDRGGDVLQDAAAAELKQSEQINVAYAADYATAGTLIAEDDDVATDGLELRKNQELIRLWHTRGGDLVEHSPLVCPQTQEYGIPETDRFLDREAALAARKRLERRYPRLRGRKLALFAPAFHQGLSVQTGYDFEFFNPGRVSDALGEDFVLALCWHPRTKSFLEDETEFRDRETVESFDLNLSRETDLNGLLLAADILITDYTDLGFAYSLLDRPMIHYWFDANDYLLRKKPGRRLTEYAWGQQVFSEEELIDALKNPRIEPDDRAAFRNRFMEKCDGHSAERIVNRIAAKW